MIKRLVIVVLGLVCTFQLSAEIKLSGIFGDNMVIQRDVPVMIWGWGDKGESVTVHFNGQHRKTRVMKNGRWELELEKMPFGGPYDMTIVGRENTIRIGNILIGDIWFCSGQSNMEFQVKEAYNAAGEIESADYFMIRSLNVPRTINALPQENVKGQWEV